MNFLKKNILVLTDGSDGMISQVIGLAKQISPKINSIKTKILFPWNNLQPGILPIYSWIFKNDLNISPKPEIIISCGRKSVYLSIYLKKKYKNAITIHIQDPKVNFKKFDYIIAPEHDKIKGNNIIASIGALHKFDKYTFGEVLDKNFDIPKNNLLSVIVGGSNHHYSFSLKEVNSLITKITYLKNINPKLNILIIFSRRTTYETKELIKDKLKNNTIVWDKNHQNPYTFALKYSDYFIVTSDSTSMISECAFTAKPIYIFHLPFKRKSKRIKKFHEQFRGLNITKDLNSTNELLSWIYKPLDESKRIASIIKERIIKESQ